MRKPLLASAFVVTLSAAACGGGTPEPVTHTNPPPPPPEEPASDGACDKTKMCAQVITCVDGQQYPTACGPSNCDAPLGPCEDAPAN